MSDNFTELGTDPGDLNDQEDPCLAAGIGGSIVPEALEILEVCQDPDSLNIVYIRANVQGVFSYQPNLDLILEDNGVETVINASSRMILGYKGSEESPSSLPFTTLCGSKTVLLAWDVGTLIPNFSSIPEIKLSLTLYGTFISEEFDHDILDSTSIFISSDPTDSIVLTKGLTPQPYALYFDEDTGQLKLQFSNLGNVSCTCNINCVDTTIENEELVPCDDEIQEVTVSSSSLIGLPSDIDIDISDSIGNTSSSSYHIVLGTTPVAPTFIRKTSPDRVVVTPHFLTEDLNKYKKSRIKYQLWRKENGNSLLLVDWTTQLFDSYIDTSIQPGAEYSYSIRVRGDFDTVSNFSASSAPVAIPSFKDRNTILFLLDDVGMDMISAYNDVNAFDSVPISDFPGSGLYPSTPNIDRLASDGVRFTNARTMPVCSPTRSNIYGGQYCFRNGVGTVIKDENSAESLSEWGVTGYDGTDRTQYPIGSLVQNAGHESVLIGKWHMALPTGERGFGDTIDPGIATGIRSGEVGVGPIHVTRYGGWNEAFAVFRNFNQFPLNQGDYYEYSEFLLNSSMTGNSEIVEKAYFLDTTQATEPEKDQVYATNVQMNHLTAWVRQKSSTENFFAMVPLNTIHSPFSPFPPEAGVSTQEAINNKDLNAFLNIVAKLESFDTKLGQFLNDMDPRQRAKTNIIFMGDNGSPGSYWDGALASPANRELGTTLDQLIATGDRFKRSVYESGCRVPLIISGPDVRHPNRTYDYFVDAVDVYTTVLDIAGVNPTDYTPSTYQVDGISFLHALHSGNLAGPGRNFSFTEHFEPNGQPSSSSSIRDRAYLERFIGTGLNGQARTASGDFKLVRLWNGVTNDDFVYYLRDIDLNPVDPFELDPLAITASDAYYQQYLELAANLQTLLQS